MDEKEQRLTKAALDVLETLGARGCIPYPGNPPSAAWEVVDAGLAYFVSGASWTLTPTPSRPGGPSP